MKNILLSLMLVLGFSVICSADPLVIEAPIRGIDPMYCVLASSTVYTRLTLSTATLAGRHGLYLSTFPFQELSIIPSTSSDVPAPSVDGQGSIVLDSTVRVPYNLRFADNIILFGQAQAGVGNLNV